MVLEGTVEARPTPGAPEGPITNSHQQSAEARVGRTVGGRLFLESVIGVGGTATVYAARHRNGRAFAVKILHPEFAHYPGVRQRFLAEGYAANRVDHPDIVAVLDEGEDETGTVFIVMELLRGKSLLELLIEHGTLPKEQVISAALRVLDVLAVAHDRGVVHRDIKPGNLFLTEEGALKVLDFGIARVEGNPGAFATRPGTTLGTPAFMAPELAAGRLEQLDALTDIWAVGATMFQLLTGEPVHPSLTDNELIVLAATRPARSLAKVRPDLEPWLVAVVDRALSFERPKRWPNARAMRAALAEPTQHAGLRTAAARTLLLSTETAPEMELPPSRPPQPGRLRSTLGWVAVLGLLIAGGVSVLALRHRAIETAPPSGTIVPSSAVLSTPSTDTPPSGGLSTSGAQPSIAAPIISAHALPVTPAQPEKHGPKVAAGSAKRAPRPAPVPATSAHANNPLFFPTQ